MTALSRMRTWYDQLSIDEKNEIDTLRMSVGVPDRILPPLHGDSHYPQLAAAEACFFSVKEPFYNIRLNDCEIGMMSGGSPTLPDLEKNYPDYDKPLDYMLFRLGFDRNAFPQRAEFLDAMAACPLLGLHQAWPPVTQQTAIALAMLGYKLPYEKGVCAGIAYYMIHRTLFNFLAGKKVVLIGSEAENLSALWKTKEFLDAYQVFGPVDRIEIVDGIRTASHPTVNWRCIDPITERLKKLSFDVALLGCGGLAKILAFRIWKDMSRTAIDVGAVFPALLGGQERSRMIMSDGKWPEVKWRVKLQTNLI